MTRRARPAASGVEGETLLVGTHARVRDDRVSRLEGETFIDLAKQMVDYIRSEGGLITMEDLAGWRQRHVRMLRPAHTNYRGYDVYTSPVGTGGQNLITILNLLKGLAGALLYLKEQGLCHLDVKLENILIMENGEFMLSDWDARPLLTN